MTFIQLTYLFIDIWMDEMACCADMELVGFEYECVLALGEVW